MSCCRYPVNKYYFKKWSHNMAYIFGLWCADGFINEYTFSIALIESDKYLLELIKKEMQIGRPVSVTNIKTGNRICKLNIGSKLLIEDIKILGGLERKSSRLELPKVPDKYFADYIRGVFDGDGTISIKKTGASGNAGIYSQSKIFLEQIKNELEKKIPDFYCKIYGNKRSTPLYQLNFSTKNVLKFGSYIYNTPSLLFLYRKYNKFLELDHNRDVSLQIGTIFDKEYFETRLIKGDTLGEIQIDLNMNGHTFKKRLKELGINWKSFYEYRKVKRPLKENYQKRLSLLSKDDITKLCLQGASLRYISELYNIDRRGLKAYCKKQNIDWQNLGKDKKESFRQSRFKTKEKASALFEAQSTRY